MNGDQFPEVSERVCQQLRMTHSDSLKNWLIRSLQGLLVSLAIYSGTQDRYFLCFLSIVLVAEFTTRPEVVLVLLERCFESRRFLPTIAGDLHRCGLNFLKCSQQTSEILSHLLSPVVIGGGRTASTVRTARERRA